MRKSDEQREAICARVEYWTQRLHVRPRLVRVQHVTQKSRSCSTSRIVTFATDLVKQATGFQDFVIAHELLHLCILNHGKLFKAVMTAHIPDWKKHDVRRRRAVA